MNKQRIDMNKNSKGSYAAVNGLKLYYEIHGAGRPLVLLHGALSTPRSERFCRPLPRPDRSSPSSSRHMGTADIDRPLTEEQMAEDTAALLRQLKLETADFFGYRMGSEIALELALRHPKLVRKLVLASPGYRRGGVYSENWEAIESSKVEDLAGSVFQAAYARAAPKPEDWPTLFAKNKQRDRAFRGWSPEEIQAIKTPTLLIIGDSDIVRPEHATELFRLLGGGVVGGVAGLPNAQLAVLPGTTHLTLVDRAEWLLSMITKFLDAPVPEAM